MDLTFQVPMQYCSLQHQSFLPSLVTFTTSCCLWLGPVYSLFELFLHWSPGAYWAPTNLGSSSFSVLSFYLFIIFMGFSRKEYWSGLPFPSPVDHTLSEFSTMTPTVVGVPSIIQQVKPGSFSSGGHSVPQRSKGGQVPIHEFFSSFSLCHICYCPIGQSK